MEYHVPFMFVTPEFCRGRFKWLRSLGKVLARLFPRLPKQLKSAYLDFPEHVFIISGLLSSFILSILLGMIFFGASFYNDGSYEKAILVGIAFGFGLWVLMFVVFMNYPSILAKKIASDVDRHLIFALRDLLLHTTSGSSMFEGLLSVSEAGYGQISKEFEGVAREINSGTPTDQALENLAKRSQSEYLKKVTWQLVNTLRAGGNLRLALDNIVLDLNSAQRANIVNYANELNLWSLIYMLFAVAAPTIGMTMMIILSSFADLGVDSTLLIFFVCVTLVIQMVIIGFIKSRRPMVEF